MAGSTHTHPRALTRVQWVVAGLVNADHEHTLVLPEDLRGGGGISRQSKGRGAVACCGGGGGRGQPPDEGFGSRVMVLTTQPSRRLPAPPLTNRRLPHPPAACRCRGAPAAAAAAAAAVSAAGVDGSRAPGVHGGSWVAHTPMPAGAAPGLAPGARGTTVSHSGSRAGRAGRPAHIIVDHRHALQPPHRQGVRCRHRHIVVDTETHAPVRLWGGGGGGGGRKQ
jgi:hypothetical protein